jgi:hypothetical protein
MRTPKQTLWLISGIGLIAVISGYMVGASQTPVVSVAIPAVFGLIVTGLGFIGSSNVEKKLEPIKEALDKNNLTQAQNTLASINNELEKNPDRIGKILVAFSAFYIIGLAFGTYARVTNLYVPNATRQLPWEQSADIQSPPTVSDAIEWIKLQEELLGLGYTREQIRNIYAIQVAEWNRQKQISSNNNSSNTNTSSGSGEQTNTTINQNSNSQGKRGKLSGRITPTPMPVALPTPASTVRPVVLPSPTPKPGRLP